MKKSYIQPLVEVQLMEQATSMLTNSLAKGQEYQQGQTVLTKERRGGIFNSEDASESAKGIW